jgi:spore maturation protein SpmA
LNLVFFILVGVAFSVGAIRELVFASGTMAALSKAVVSDAAGAVTLALGLIGVMTLFLGLMKVAEAGGLLTIVARALRPALVRLFPDLPPSHPAMGAMIMNISANVLGLGNAATPFGIRAMQLLDRLNPAKGTASNAMILFLAINTSSVTLLPTGVIALRAAAGSADPAGILPTTLFATACSTVAAIALAKLCCRLWPLSPAEATTGGTTGEHAPTDEGDPPLEMEPVDRPYPGPVSALILAGIVLLLPLSVFFGSGAAPWIIPALVFALLAFGIARRVPIYETFVEGARDGFSVAVRIIPYLVAILVAVGMMRASGALDLLMAPLGTFTAPLGLPAEGLLMGLLRTLSGSGAYAFLASILNDPAIGPDSYTGYLVSTIQGSTETTFYVLAVYFGAVNIRRMRHAVLVGLGADAIGVAAAVFICRLMFGG